MASTGRSFEDAPRDDVADAFVGDHEGALFRECDDEQQAIPSEGLRDAEVGIDQSPTSYDADAKTVLG